MRGEKAPDNFSQCRKCGARIIFVRMKSGKSMSERVVLMIVFLQRLSRALQRWYGSYFLCYKL